MSLSQLKQGLNLTALVVLLLIFLILWQGVVSQPAKALDNYLAAAKPPVELWLGSVKIEVDIADTPLEHARGLSGRIGLNQFSGMLFIFDADAKPNFWMKNMNFPLDILWLNSAGRVVEITSNVSPDTYPEVFSPKQPIRYVLELNAGFSDSFNIGVGDSLRPLSYN